ncbi:hypothetical protein I316_07910 [Kwoniella heveanensis BCC8398]|uniref:Uncharacterized protein n=1 Tax=Kwoniella heveanensis BCC8398 TaxID=1296120 RepID=A0A1B9GHC8_9TREE|nr:hypothetical protein I316_07910 [Kwoniella heveanensis BCC8398]
MSLLTTLASFQTPLTILLVIFGPSLLPKVITFFRTSTHPRSGHLSPHGHPTFPRAKLSTTLKLLLAVHTLWLISHLVRPPYDLFVGNRLPILTSNAQLRAALFKSVSPTLRTKTNSDGSLGNLPDIHPLLELLLTKLKVLENRYLYARYGHAALQDCVWCQSSLDYLIFSLPCIGGWYLLEAVFIGLLGLDRLWNEAGSSSSSHQVASAQRGRGAIPGSSSREASQRAYRWRGLTGWSLFGAALAEVGLKYGWEVRAVEGDCVHLASTMHTLRTIFLLLLPFIYVYLPTPRSSASTISPDALIPVISNTTSTLRLTALARKGIQRSPRTREYWSMIGRREAELSEVIKRDEGVRQAVKGSGGGMGLDQEALRNEFRAWISEGCRGMVRVDEGGQGEGARENASGS